MARCAPRPGRHHAPCPRLSHDGVVIDHLSIQCTDLAASAAFYDTVLATIGGQRLMDFGTVIGYGVPPFPETLAYVRTITTKLAANNQGLAGK